MKAVIYARYSSDRQTEDSIAAQVRACKEYAQQHDIIIVDTYIDEAVSGRESKTASREAYQKMIKSTHPQKGDILYCLRGSLGKKAIVNDEVRGAIASSLVIIRPDRKKVNGDYLMFSLDAPTIREQLTKANNGSTQPNLSASSVREFRIELPTLLVQKDVVEKLTKLQHVIEKRQNQINLLDKLVKARFVEMFGDPEMNPYGWQKINISNIVQGKVSNGYFAKRDEYVEDGNAAILGVAYIVNRMYSGIEGLPRTNVTLADIQKYKVRYGDMLFCRSSLVAEGIGKASIVPENVPDNTLFECHVIRLPLDMDKCVTMMRSLSNTSASVPHRRPAHDRYEQIRCPRQPQGIL